LGDRAATYLLVRADYGLDKALLVHVHVSQAAEVEAAKALGQECKGVLAGAPEESVLEEEGPSAPRPALSGRRQGEQARSEQEKQVLELEIEETLSAAANVVIRGAEEAYIATIQKLSWSDPTINALIQRRAQVSRTELAKPRVGVCAELRGWAASGFQVLPPEAKSLQETEDAPSRNVVSGNLQVLLMPYEDAASRAILRRVEALRKQLKEARRADEAGARAIYNMDRALGERVSRFAEQQLAPVIGKGKTAAGTTFVIRAAVGKNPSGACAHSVDVEIRERSGGSGGGLCLGKGASSRPSGECSGSVETIELVTPPSVRNARVLFSNGRSTMVSVIPISAKDGGPAGVLIGAFRGYNPYPISVQELSSHGTVLKTVSLGRIRCEKETAANSVGAPQFIPLATAMTPFGEPLTITGTLHRVGLQTEFFLGPQPGRRSKEATEGTGPPKQFQWELSTECAPHAYSLLDGILLAPGTSVLARTATGLTPLTKVELAATTHAKGPLLYGVYATPPTEIVVERSDGSILYTENLAAQATEETEYCDGYTKT
jgi:hypothetical protein